MFSEEERLIFGPYFDGRADVHGDPVRILRRLKTLLEGDVNKFLTQARSDVPELACIAYDRLIDATVQSFDLVGFDKVSGEGLTEDRVMSVLVSFTTWIDDVKKNGETPPTWPAPTEPTPSPGGDPPPDMPPM